MTRCMHGSPLENCYDCLLELATRERDEARALLREVAQGELLSPAMGAFMDIQLPMQVWIAVRKAAKDGR